jgi:phosphoribosyl-ATP pyrophosphohydrolase
MTEQPPGSSVLARVFAVIESRRGGDAKKSHTAKLFAKGRQKIAQKVGEEAVETVIAATAGDRRGVVAESSDLLFHLMVLWAECGIEPEEIYAELARREGISGLIEKKQRRKFKRNME